MKKLVLILLATLLLVSCSTGNSEGKENIAIKAVGKLPNGADTEMIIIGNKQDDVLKFQYLENRMTDEQIPVEYKDTWDTLLKNVSDQYNGTQGVKHVYQRKEGITIERMTFDYDTASQKDLMALGIIDNSVDPDESRVSFKLTKESVEEQGYTLEEISVEDARKIIQDQIKEFE